MYDNNVQIKQVASNGYKLITRMMSKGIIIEGVANRRLDLLSAEIKAMSAQALTTR